MAGTRSVVVTGASTGIGAAAVAALVRDGMVVWATVRRQGDADRLTAEHGEAVRPLLMDLEDADSVRAAGATVAAAGPLMGLVNNAGRPCPARWSICRLRCSVGSWRSIWWGSCWSPR